MAGQFDHALAIYHAVGLAQRRLNDELVQRRADEIRRVLERVLHVLRDAGRDASALVGIGGHGVGVSRLGVIALSGQWRHCTMVVTF